MASNSTETFTLNSGAKIPAVGFGTAANKGDEGYKAVLDALNAGYRHLDTAHVYYNEEQVGRAIKESGIPREELFVTTKLTEVDHRNAPAALDASLKRLGLSYVDLYLIHWPTPKIQGADGSVKDDTEWDIVKTWHSVQELVKTGKTKSVGVSNFSTKQLEQVLNDPGTKVVPAVNQVELHPYLPQTKLTAYTDAKGIITTAYSPLAAGKANVVEDATIKAIASAHKVDAGQVIISWIVSRGIVAIPKSGTKSRIESNFKTVKLSAEEIEKINNLHKEKTVRVISPDGGKNLFHDGDN